MYARKRKPTRVYHKDQDPIDLGDFSKGLGSGESVPCIDEETGEVGAIDDPLKAYRKELSAIGLLD